MQNTGVKYNALNTSFDQLKTIIQDPDLKLGSVGAVTKFLDNLQATVTNINDVLFEKTGAARRNANNLDNVGRREAEKVLDDNIANLTDRNGVNVQKYFQDSNPDLLEKLRTFAGKSAAHKAVFTELLYTIAKFREEGGRFSVSDIELAAASLGALGGSKRQALEALEALRENFTRRAYSDITTLRPVLELDQYEGLLPDNFDKLSKVEKEIILQDLYLKQNPKFKPFFKTIFNKHNEYLGKKTAVGKDKNLGTVQEGEDEIIQDMLNQGNNNESTI